MTGEMGLLIMAYGTPCRESDIEPYYTDIRHGRRPSGGELQDLEDRYEFIGGLSPLAGTTDDQVGVLVSALNKAYADVEFKPYLGLKHISSFVENAVKQMHDDGITGTITVVLTPHCPLSSVGSYDRRADEEAAKYGIQPTHVKHYYEQPKFVEYWTNKVNETLTQIPEEGHKDAVLAISTHSLPKGLIERSNDPYPQELEYTALLIKEQSNTEHIAISWQSEGSTDTPWLGPGVQDLTRDLYERHQYRNFVYTPVGLVYGHPETLYDNDYKCKVVCDDIGVSYYRPRAPNTHPLFIGTIVDEIKSIF